MGTRYAPLVAREALAAEIRQLEATKANQGAWAKITRKDLFEKRIKESQARLAAITPPDVDSSARPALRKRLSNLHLALTKGNAQVPAMLNRRGMQDPHPGDVGQLT